jgi:hypothetical protein
LQELVKSNKILLDPLRRPFAFLDGEKAHHLYRNPLLNKVRFRTRKHTQASQEKDELLVLKHLSLLEYFPLVLY